MVHMIHKTFLIRVLVLLLLSTWTSLTMAQNTQICGTESGQGCAPESARVDLALPTFSNPTHITNPLFPIRTLKRVLFYGTVERLPFHTETTLLPDTRFIEWNGQKVETLTSQYMAFLDGRINELALDWYAQADDGSVWYFGEDVFDYQDGVVVSTGGTWLAGKDGPPAMIMPGQPKVGDVYRPENSPGFVFEEVTVTAVDTSVHGPHGMVEGAIVTQELHMDGTHEGKIFAPGYGEFFTGQGGQMEALTLALPIDSLSAALPTELDTLFNGATQIFGAVQSADWDTASATVDTMRATWNIYQAGDLPALLDARMSWALAELTASVDAHQSIESRQSAIHVAHVSLDFQLRYRSVVDIDYALFDLWAAQIGVDAAAADLGGAVSDVTTLEWVWDRIAHTVSDAQPVETVLKTLRTTADSQDLTGMMDAAERLRAILIKLNLAS